MRSLFFVERRDHSDLIIITNVCVFVSISCKTFPLMFVSSNNRESKEGHKQVKHSIFVSINLFNVIYT